jgi:hypothetical protein
VAFGYTTDMQEAGQLLRNHFTFLEAVSETDLAVKTSATTGNSLLEVTSRKIRLNLGRTR